MKLIRNLLIFLLIVFGFWFLYGENYEDAGINGVVNEIETDLTNLAKHPVVENTVEGIRSFIASLTDNQLFGDHRSEPQPIEDTELTQPEDGQFSIHNIEIGNSRTQVEQEAGTPERTTLNEYGVQWEAYHENYHNFFMAAYDEEDRVIGLYTNQHLLSSQDNISFETSREELLETLHAAPVDTIRKGLVNYEVNSEGEFDIFHINDQYVTFFYDIHEGHTVTAVQIIDEKMEQNKSAYFGEVSNELKEGFEYQLFDLTNAARVKHGLSVLQWETPLRQTARDHSEDMAVNNYFSHTGLDGRSPFERMEQDGITFRIAGENLAAGQPSSIFAHQGLMNSLGHRENILKDEFNHLAVGVAFNDDAQPFYTEKFITQ
jgi:uncharacterized protein YkwD